MKLDRTFRGIDNPQKLKYASVRQNMSGTVGHSNLDVFCFLKKTKSFTYKLAIFR